MCIINLGNWLKIQTTIVLILSIHYHTFYATGVSLRCTTFRKDKDKGITTEYILLGAWKQNTIHFSEKQRP